MDISLEIGGFTAPNADYAASLYAWTLSVERWGSGDVIRQFTGTGPQTQPGSILINYWRPHSSYPESEIIKDIVLYMDISFTITNAIN